MPFSLNLITKGLIILCACTSLLGGVQTFRLHIAKKEVERHKIALVQCKTALQEERSNREQERKTDVEIATRQTIFCRVERDAAITAGRSIQGIVDGKDSSGNARSDIVTADELRDIVSEKRPTRNTR